MEYEVDLDNFTQEIILAASKHDIDALNVLLRTGSANVQDLESGFTPLHAAIASCEQEEPSKENSLLTDGSVSTSPKGELPDIVAAEKTVLLLLQNGAIWNDLNLMDETPGCIALRLNLNEIYELIVDAGVRAELLLNHLSEYEMLSSDDSSVEEEVHVNNELVTLDHTQNQTTLGVKDQVVSANSNYLRAKVGYENDRLVDGDRNGVMMAWETRIMQLTVDHLAPRKDFTCLNIGHGMGIIDELLQAKSPVLHHIVEAHPDVIHRMRKHGWYDKSNVVIHNGRWQDVLPKLIEYNFTFDIIYYDTFAEDYKAFKEFFSHHVIQLLNPFGKWSFFHGLGADRRICYDVYTKVVEIDLFEAGFDVSWAIIPVPEQSDPTIWKGIRRRYWTLNEYKLPICNFLE